MSSVCDGGSGSRRVSCERYHPSSGAAAAGQRGGYWKATLTLLPVTCASAPGKQFQVPQENAEEQGSKQHIVIAIAVALMLTL